MKTKKTVLLSLALLATSASRLEAGILHDLVKAEDLIGLRSLLNPELQKELKIDINGKGAYGDTPLIRACEQNQPNIEIIKLLIQNGADLNALGWKNRTALHFACIGSDFEIAKLLIENGAKLHDESNDTPLTIACEKYNPNIDIIKLLIQSGADLNAVGYQNRTALQWACINNHFEIVTLLIQGGADLNATGYANRTALHYINTQWTPEERTKLFKALATTKPNVDGNTKAFAGLALESMIERLQQDIVPPLLADNDKLYDGNKYITNPKELIQLLHARMRLFFGPKKHDIFPNHIPGDGLSLEMKKLDQQVFVEMLQKLIETRYYNSHRNMSPRKVNTFKILERFTQALIEKYNSTHNLNNPKTYTLTKSPYLKFRDIGICFE